MRKAASKAPAATALVDAADRAEAPRVDDRSARGSVSDSRSFVVVFAVFLLALLWAAVGYQLNRDKTTVLDAARTNSINLARAYAEHVVGTLRLLDQVLLRVQDEYAKNGATPDLARESHERSIVNLATYLIGVIDDRGYIVASSVPLPESARSVGDREYFRAHSGKASELLYVSEPLQGRSTGKQIVALSRRLNRPDGSFGGVAFASFDPQYLSGFFTDLVISKGSGFAVVGRDMIIRDLIGGSGRVPAAIGQSLAKSPLAPALARAASGTYRAVGVIDGVARIFSYRAVPDYPLVVLASVGEADALAAFREREAWLIGAAVALTLIFAGAAGYQLQRLTRQLRADQELRETQELLIESQRVAKLGYVLHDVPNDRLYWSDSMFEIRGIPRRGPFTLEEASQFMVPEDRVRYFAARREAFSNRHGFEIEVRFRQPDGGIRWEHRAVQPHFNAEGELVRVLVVVRDITVRKKNDEALRRSRESLARAQRIASLGSFERDLVSGEVQRSEEFYRLWGIADTSAAITAEQLALLVHPEDRQKFLAAREEALRNASADPLDFRIIRADGTERILHSEYGADFDEAGKPIRLFCVVQDVTERKAIEMELRRSRENLIRAQEIARVGSFERDFHSGRIEWSDEMYQILGIEKGDAPPGPETLMKLVHPDDRERVAAYRQAETSGDTIGPIEYRILRPNGEERFVRRESDMIFDDARRPLHRYGTMQDITELRLAERRERELERQLMHSQKLEALGTLASGIAHDLNNTLVPIMGLSKLTARQLPAGSDARINLDMISAASEQARDLVKRVLAYVRMDSSEKRPVKLTDAVGEALKLLRATIPASIQIEERIVETPLIMADVSQIHQIVTNLVSNAAGAIGNRIGTIQVDLEDKPGPPRHEIVLSVSDTGVGMDQATQARIFEPFYTTKSVGEGTGLGLAIVQGIVADHGGRIEVTSEPGKGTRIDIYFPAANLGARAAA